MQTWSNVPVRCAGSRGTHTTQLLCEARVPGASMRPYRWETGVASSTPVSRGAAPVSPIDLGGFDIPCPICRSRGLYQCGRCFQASCGGAVDGRLSQLSRHILRVVRPRPVQCKGGLDAKRYGTCGWCGDREPIASFIESLPAAPLKK
jgi:hypothetical protein